MASLVEGIVAYLLTQGPVAAIVGSNIQPIPTPVGKENFPCITFQVVSDPTDYTLTGTTGVGQARLLFSCLTWYGPGSYLTARSLGRAVKEAFSAYQGTLPGGPQVFFAKVVNVVDMFQQDAMLSATNVSVIFTYQD